MRNLDRGREPALDGIRGLAILLVLYHHVVLYSGLTKAPGAEFVIATLGKASWVGVDLFFVLSGFLISGILLEAKKTEHYFRNFYTRRALRIFPLYYAVLAASFLLLPLLLSQASAAPAGAQAWYWLYASNVQVALERWQEPAHLAHFWSLAVEEQFYLLWPLAVFASSRRGLMRLCVACLAGALLLRWLLPLWLHPLAGYVLMPARMDAFAAGAIVALLMRAPGGLTALGAWPRRALVASLAALAAIALWRRGLSYVDPVVQTIGYSLIALASASLIAVVLGSPRDGAPRRLFSNAVLVTLGKYSYAIYVFHHPVLLLMRDAGLGVRTMPWVQDMWAAGLLLFSAAALGITFLCALASWRLIEAPFLRLKRHWPSPDFRGRPAGGASSTWASRA